MVRLIILAALLLVCLDCSAAGRRKRRKFGRKRKQKVPDRQQGGSASCSGGTCESAAKPHGDGRWQPKPSWRKAARGMTVRVAVVATVKGASDDLLTWIRYHLSIGFSRIYLFFDDPSGDMDMLVRVRNKFPPSTSGVESIISDGRLHMQQRKRNRLYQQLGEQRLQYEQMARQMMNAETALQMASTQGIDWLLHIDSDELFVAPQTTVPEHFQRLAALGATQAVYLNHEAVYSSPSKTASMFASPWLKRNINAVHPSNMKHVREWREYHMKYHVSYTYGKAAVRCIPSVIPLDVSLFKIPEGTMTFVLETPFIAHFTNHNEGVFTAKYARAATLPSQMDQSDFFKHMVKLVRQHGSDQLPDVYSRVCHVVHMHWPHI